MKKKQLNKNINRSIKHSWGRFISIMLLMMLGSFALLGLFVTGPDMRSTSINYFKKYNTADITILSDYGISETEMSAIESVSDIKEIEYIYLKDVIIKDTNTSVRIFSSPSTISLYELKEGNYPINDDEIAIDYSLKDEYPLNSTISFTEKSTTLSTEDTLIRHEYTVVGYIYSSEILGATNKGTTTVGTGTLNAYAIVNKSNFNSSVYMMAKIRFNDTYDLDPYSDEYQDNISSHKEELSTALNNIKDIRFTSIKETSQDTIDKAEETLNKAKEELENAKKTLTSAQNKLSSAKKTIKSSETALNNAKETLDNASNEISTNEETLKIKEQEYQTAKTTLEEKEQEYNTALATYNEAKKEVEEAEITLKESKETLTQIINILNTVENIYNNGTSNIEENITKLTNLINNSSLTKEEKENLLKRIDEINTNYNSYKTLIESIYKPIKITVSNNEKLLEEKELELESAKTTLNEKKNLLDNAKIELENGKQQLSDARTTLDNAYTTIENAKEEVNNGYNEYYSNLNKINNAKSTLKSQENKYNTALKEYEEQEPSAIEEITNGEEQLNTAKETLTNLSSPTYYVYSRSQIPGSAGYTIYGTISTIIDDLAKIFPVFLYFVAALVTLTTMTRFVYEERIINGTLKSLGYSDYDIIHKFTKYGLIAGLTGTIIGIILGSTLLPMIVYNTYKTGFTLPEIELHFYPTYSLLAIILSLCSSVIPAYIVAKRELKERPAALLLPPAPKAGTKILLERIKPIWNKLNFTHKVTARNIFRYKSRMLMTIFGVAGATAILFTGFSVQSSISKINDRQFNDIIKYDLIIAKNDVTTSSEKEEYNTILNDTSIKSNLQIYYDTSTITNSNKETEDIKVIIPEDTTNFRDYINLVNRKTKEELSLDNDGVVISERLADLLNVFVGDTFTFTDSSDIKHTVKVSGICEMYTGHFMFMNSNYYEITYDKEYKTNSNLVLVNDKSISNVNNISSKFMMLSSVKGIVSNTSMQTQIETITKSLNKIMMVLTIVAGLLAIVIIYNLTNINVSERIRELSTIKVLGFRDNEVTMYIYRETIILTVIAIVVGWLIGMGLHSYILAIVPPDDVMFNPEEVFTSYLIPFILITIINIIMQIYIHKKLQNIDMLEALKSVD